MGVGSGYPTPISGSEVQEGNFQLLDYQDAVVVSDTSFTLYNDSAKELAQRQHSFSSPVLRTDGSLAVVYHQEGTGIRIESASETLTSRNLEQKNHFSVRFLVGRLRRSDPVEKTIWESLPFI